jgi:hypothetical protein
MQLVNVELRHNRGGLLEQLFIVEVLELGPHFAVVHEAFDIRTVTVNAHHDFYNVEGLHSVRRVIQVFL